jgi:hypothetical protein
MRPAPAAAVASTRSAAAPEQHRGTPPQVGRGPPYVLMRPKMLARLFPARSAPGAARPGDTRIRRDRRERRAYFSRYRGRQGATGARPARSSENDLPAGPYDGPRDRAPLGKRGSCGAVHAGVAARGARLLARRAVAAARAQQRRSPARGMGSRLRGPARQLERSGGDHAARARRHHRAHHAAAPVRAHCAGVLLAPLRGTRTPARHARGGRGDRIAHLARTWRLRRAAAHLVQSVCQSPRAVRQLRHQQRRRNREWQRPAGARSGAR